MKKQKLLKKAKSAARFSLVMLVCLATVLSIMPVSADAANKASYQGYEWTRMDNRSEFEAYRNKVLTKSDGNIASGAEYERGNNMVQENVTKDSDWFRIMLVYYAPESGTPYIVSGSSYSGELFYGQPVQAASGIDLNKKTFTTVSGLNTPYIKYHNKDEDNDCNRYFLRFSSDDSLGDRFWTMNIYWAGIIEHAACRCEFSFPGQKVASYSDLDHREWYGSQSMKWIGNKVQIFYNVPNAADRGWEVDSDGSIECTQGYDDFYFCVYIGEKVSLQVVDTAITLEAGQVYNWNNVIIEKPVTVPVGATLVLDGISYSCSKINVDGGKLIIRGVLDTKLNYKTVAGIKVVDTSKGVFDLVASNGGTILVEDTGTLLTRIFTSEFSFSSGAIFDVQGVAVLSSYFAIEDASIRVGYGGSLFVGVVPKETAGQSTFTKEWILRKGGGYSLSSICSDLGQKCYNVVWPHSSIISNGLFFVSPYMQWHYETDIVLSFIQNYNIDSSLGDMRK